MTSTDLKRIMRVHRKFLDMTSDPDLTGNTLLVALGMLALSEQRREANCAAKTRRRSWLEELATLTGLDPRSVKYAIGDDTPRYQHATPRTYRCVAPMIRREGLCGKAWTSSYLDRDPETGEAQYVGYCSRHWTPDRQDERKRRHLEWQANGSPVPPPNTGGVLPRYFTSDWDHMYQWAAPHLTPAAATPEPPAPLPAAS